MKKQLPAMSPIRKRSFLLFELIISLALITLCLFPLIQTHAQLRKQNQKEIETIQVEQLAQEAFCYLKEKLYEHEIPWKKIKKEIRGTLDKDFTCWLGPKMAKKLTCNYRFEKIERRSKHGSSGLVIQIELEFLPIKTKFHRTLFIQGRGLAA